jgi:hypothetical protein
MLRGKKMMPPAGPLKKLLRSAPVLALLMIWIMPYPVAAEELEIINRPVNSSGLTGLMYTTMPQTLPERTFETGLMMSSETSFQPDYTQTCYPAMISYGLGKNGEVALRAAYWDLQESGKESARGFGDTELSYKWNVLPQEERSVRPGIAIFATGILPTGDRGAGTKTVQHWGMRIGLSAGSEIELDDYVLGIYADGQVAFQDVNDSSWRDRYQMLNLGTLLPISKYRNLQMFVEYNRMGGRDHPALHQVDYGAFTYGLRLVNERFNLTVGAQFIHRHDTGYEDASRVSGLISIKL